MRTLGWLAALGLVLFSFGLSFADSGDNLAPCQLTDEQYLALEVDILAKAISQKRPRYMKMVLAEDIIINGIELPRDSAISEILTSWGGARTDLARPSAQPERSKQKTGPKSANVRFVNQGQATAVLMVSKLLPKGNRTYHQETLVTMELVFNKTKAGWKITSLRWGK